MSEILEAIVLGIIQGLTEFLPVSSSGHLEIAKFLLGDQSSAESSLLVTVVLHAATAISTIIVFRKYILELILNCFQRKGRRARKLLGMLTISMIPAVLVGLSMESTIESLFTQNLLLVGAMLIVTALLLYFSDKVKDTDHQFNFGKSFIVGLAQAFAILPGISRSGSTIAMALFLNISRERAARFSFLMVIPIILGKIAKEFMEGDIHAYSGSHAALFFGFLAALISGYAACVWMIRLVKHAKLSYFALYCIIVGITVIIIHFFR